MFVYLASLEEKRITVLEVFYLNFIMHGVFGVRTQFTMTVICFHFYLFL